MITRLPYCWLAMVLLLSASCSKPALPGPKPYPVSGRVVYRGQLAKGFRVAFHPLGNQGKKIFAPSAMTDQDGAFRLQSYAPDDGAPAGEYAVTFQWPQPLSTGDPSDAAPEFDRLKGRYNDPHKSKYRVTVHESPNELEPFVLQ